MQLTELYQVLQNEMEMGNRAAVATVLHPETRQIESALYREADLRGEGNGDPSLQLARDAIQKGKLQMSHAPDGRVYRAEPYFPESRLIVLGGGHIAKPLVEFAAKTGFSVTIVDDRPIFANRQRFPDAKRVLCESFHTCFPLLNLNRSAFVVIITRGHRYDMDCLRQVLAYETAYTGMIGSGRRVRAARQQLLEENYPKEKLDAVQAPIGLDIGAVTPEEIAVSILSQVISYKRLVAKKEWPDVDHEVLAELSAKREEPRAVATIISAKGSVPRQVGAKMVVFPDGRTLGSIGGGCSEGSVKQAALDVMQTGKFQIVSVDMTGQVAEEEGMVCGGIMDVSVEPA